MTDTIIVHTSTDLASLRLEVSKELYRKHEHLLIMVDVLMDTIDGSLPSDVLDGIYALLKESGWCKDD